MPTSSKKSKPERPKTKKAKVITESGFEILEVSVETSSDQQISRLQQDLTDEKDGRLEERFNWIAVSSFISMICFTQVIPPLAWALFGPLYLIFLIIAAKRCGVDDVVVFLSDFYARYIKSKEDTD